MVEIRSLNHLDPEDLRRLNAGYTSWQKYEVRKSETNEKTTFSLELITMEAPYVKRWETDEDEVERSQRVVGYGLSLAAYDGEQMVGIALAEPQRWNRSLWVWEFHIRQSHQRMGVGRRLMEALVEKARSAGLRILVCETQNTNMPAVSFYRAMGFEIDGIDLSYYGDEDVERGEVAIFMKRKL